MIEAQPTLGQILSRAWEPELARAAEARRAQLYAAAKLARHVADAMDGVCATDALEAMAQLPDNMLDLLHSPEGWVAIAAYITQGAVVLPMPVRH